MLTLTHLIGEATVQAGPCLGRRRFGVPTGGAFDAISLAIANRLVGNLADTAGVEFTLARATLTASAQTCFAVVGASDQRRVLLQPEETYEITPNIIGARTYLAISGGVQIPSGSSLVAPIQLGFQGESFHRPIRLANLPRSFISSDIRVMEGPQASLFDLPGILVSPYKVGRFSNRVGLRLTGPAWPHTISLPSEPCTPGAIQVTPDGSLIILGPDGPTIGGYPKPLVVISADLPKLGQFMAGSPVEFRLVSLDQAHQIRREVRAKDQMFFAQLQSAIESSL